jgi:hypothetical protein
MSQFSLSRNFSLEPSGSIKRKIQDEEIGNCRWNAPPRFFVSLRLQPMAMIFCNQDNGAYDDLRKNIVKLITGDR